MVKEFTESEVRLYVWKWVYSNLDKYKDEGNLVGIAKNGSPNPSDWESVKQKDFSFDPEPSKVSLEDRLQAVEYAVAKGISEETVREYSLFLESVRSRQSIHAEWLNRYENSYPTIQSNFARVYDYASQVLYNIINNQRGVNDPLPDDGTNHYTYWKQRAKEEIAKYESDIASS